MLSVPLKYEAQHIRITRIKYLFKKTFIWRFVKKLVPMTNTQQITVPICNLEFFEAQSRIRSDQKCGIWKKFVIQAMVVMNTKEATAYFIYVSNYFAVFDVIFPAMCAHVHMTRVWLWLKCFTCYSFIVLLCFLRIEFPVWKYSCGPSLKYG